MRVPQFRCVAAAAALLAVPLPAFGQTPPPASAKEDSVAGDYVHSQMELVAGLRLRPDGTFEYGLTVGSHDERAQGRWSRAGDRIALVSAPRPVEPAIVAGPIHTAPGAPFSIRLLGPDGQDIPAIDVRIDFDSGPPLESYLPGGPWSLPPGEKRAPRFVTFHKESYRLRSKPLPLSGAAGTVATFRLIPNDWGVVDLTGAYLEIDGKDLILSRPEGSLRFGRARD